MLLDIFIVLNVLFLVCELVLVWYCDRRFVRFEVEFRFGVEYDAFEFVVVDVFFFY